LQFIRNIRRLDPHADDLESRSDADHRSRHGLGNLPDRGGGLGGGRSRLPGAQSIQFLGNGELQLR
jgi:hypothetical protein